MSGQHLPEQFGAEPHGERPRGRAGRPPKELAGEVDARILEAARRVFLERGLAGASIDEIAARAGAGKPTIYARFPGKEALFTAVVMRQVETKVTWVERQLHAGGSLEARLREMAVQILDRALTRETIDLMRLSISEARRFPDLASGVHGMACERGAEPVARLLAAAVQSDEFSTSPAFAPERLVETARFFLDLMFAPLIIKALFGEKLEAVRARIETHVDRGVAVFLAGCRSGAMG
jgi:AcrR family transcriptional regulator